MKSMPIDTTALRFLVTSAPEPVVNFETKQPKVDKDGQPIHSIDLLVSREGRKGELVTVKVAGASPKVGEGERVKVSGLEAFAWENDGKHGISFTAQKVEPAATEKAAA